MNKVHDNIQHVVKHFKRKEPQYRKLKNQVKLLLEKKLSKTDLRRMRELDSRVMQNY